METRVRSIETIMCAFDFSKTSEVALEQAVRLARRHRAGLLLTHIVEPIPLGPYPALMAAGNELGVREIAVERIEAFVKSLLYEDLEIDTRVELGVPGPEIIRVAESAGVDLIVIGTRGLTGLKHLVMGSTAEYVVSRSRCPVMSVHSLDRVSTESIETIILPTDLSAAASDALNAFVEIFGDTQKPRVLLVYADQTPPYLEPFRHEADARWSERDSIKEEIARRLEPVAAHLRDAGFETEVLVLNGGAVSVVTELADERRADMILLSTRGRSVWIDALVGRTAQRIVQYAGCPVLTVRPHERIASGEPSSEVVA
jgi:nucleotide-binding universal stress UspA family protein